MPYQKFQLHLYCPQNICSQPVSISMNRTTILSKTTTLGSISTIAVCEGCIEIQVVFGYHSSPKLDHLRNQTSPSRNVTLNNTISIARPSIHHLPNNQCNVLSTQAQSLFDFLSTIQTRAIKQCRESLWCMKVESSSIPTLFDVFYLRVRGA